MAAIATAETQGYFQGDDGYKHQLGVPKAPISTSWEYQNGTSYHSEGWITLHDGDLQPAVREVIRNIQYVSHDTFCKALSSSTQSISKREKFDPSEDAIVLVEGKKSNKWVAEIAQDQDGFRAAAYYRLGEKDARGFSDYFDSLEPEELELERKNFKDKVIVLFDDGSYSGKQMCDHVTKVQDVVRVNKLAVRAIAVIVPYMTQYASDRLTEIAETSKENVPLWISTHKRIPTLADLSKVTRDKIALAWFKGSHAPLNKLGLLWYDHKVPNDQSFPGPIVSRSVYNSEGKSVRGYPMPLIPLVIPPYKY